MRQIMFLPSKRITLDVEPSVHLTGPETLELSTTVTPHELRFPVPIWDVLATPPPLLNLSGVKAITVQDDGTSSPTAEFLDRGRIVMTTPARRLTLDLDDSVRLLGPEVLEVDSFDGRSKMTAWEVLAYHLSGFEALYEEGGVRVLSVEGDSGDA